MPESEQQNKQSPIHVWFESQGIVFRNFLALRNFPQELDPVMNELLEIRGKVATHATSRELAFSRIDIAFARVFEKYELSLQEQQFSVSVYCEIVDRWRFSLRASN